MSKTIQILSDLTINQIAAGEVIENPASVVKELVENAVDAGASQITLETRAGGFQWIKLSDNGSGMSPEDAILCLERHATSKILNADDLFNLHTMGFRGEALASIASISKMTIVTSIDGERATCVRVEGGKITSVAAAARSQGTTIEINSLFYNVPARKKFQKSPAASSAEITKTMTHLSLAHPSVSFTLIQQDCTVFSTLAEKEKELLEQLKERGKALLHKDFISSCKELQFNEPQLQGVGLIATPSYARHNRSGQYLFINNRPVNCPCISYAIKDAYGTRLSQDKHPVYLIHFSIPPSLIDVNVHPQKKEVRLRNESILKYTLHAAVNATLAEGAPSFSPSFEESIFKFKQQPFEEEAPLFLREKEEEEPSPTLFQAPLHLIGLYKHYALIDAASLPTSFSEKEGIVLCHLRSAEKRVQFETLLRNAKTTPASQGLLFPLTFNCSVAEADLLHIQLPLLKQMGLSIEQAGKETFLINAIPPFLDETEIQSALLEIVSSQKNKTGPDLKEIATLLSCKVSRASRNYSLEEARYLVGSLLKTTDPYHCPQGRSTIFTLKEVEIENRF